jgi:hypothetical protein
MLAFEKAAQGKISLRVKERGPLLSRNFAFALGCALFVHLLFLLLFQIAPIKVVGEGIFLPPFQVETDLGQETAAQLEQPSHYETGLPPFPYSVPQAKPLSSLQLRNADENWKLLAEFEEKSYRPAYPPRLRPKPPSVQLFFSGTLAEAALLNRKEWEALVPPIAIETRAIFQAAVDPQLGRIFWYERLQAAESSPLDQFAEGLLLMLEFEPHPLHFLSGQVEIHFIPPGSS